MLVPDGVYVRTASGSHFKPLAGPTPAELQALVQRLAERVGRQLERHGILVRDSENSHLALEPDAEENALPGLQGFSITVPNCARASDVALGRERHSLRRDGGAADIAAQALQLGALIRLCRDPGVKKIRALALPPPRTAPRCAGFVAGRLCALAEPLCAEDVLSGWNDARGVGA